jgi:transcription elongation GreA/GreB family factor
LSFNQEKIFVISAESPLAKAMNGKKTGESFVVNNLTQIIKNIW